MAGGGGSFPFYNFPRAKDAEVAKVSKVSLSLCTSGYLSCLENDRKRGIVFRFFQEKKESSVISGTKVFRFS